MCRKPSTTWVNIINVQIFIMWESTVKINKYVVTNNLFSFLTTRWEHSNVSRSCFETISWCSIFLMRKRLTEWEDLSIEVKPRKGGKKRWEKGLKWKAGECKKYPNIVDTISVPVNFSYWKKNWRFREIKHQIIFKETNLHITANTDDRGALV